jgi:hypothetical protein
MRGGKRSGVERDGGFRKTARRRLSERPEFKAPAFQFLLAAGGDVYAPLGEGGFDLRDHCTQAAVETPLV